MMRLALESDLPRIVEIYNASIADRMATADLSEATVESRRSWFREHGEKRPLWVCDVEGEVAAWISLSNFHPRCAYEITAEVGVYVDPKFRRRGLAQDLLKQAVLEAPTLGIENLVALIFGHNEPSLRLFKNHGFERWGHLPAVANMAGIRRDLEIYGRRLKSS
ncbi:MAG: N-acetyltransferase family protein [Planctomycetota bacterium]